MLSYNENQTQNIITQLLNAGFTNEDISILSPNRDNIRGAQGNDLTMNKEGKLEYNPWNKDAKAGKTGAIGIEKSTKAPEGATTGATAGGIIGGSIGLLAGIGTLAIPGLGAFVAAGPIIAALSGSGIGGALGLLVGTLIGLGIPEFEAKKYESSLKEGKVLISCRIKNDDLEDRCKEIMKNSGATDICASREIAKTR